MEISLVEISEVQPYTVVQRIRKWKLDELLEKIEAIKVSTHDFYYQMTVYFVYMLESRNSLLRRCC